MSRWDAPDGVESLAAPQRVGFGLVCTEHIRPSFELQVHAHPASLPPGTLTVSEYRACVEALWSWLSGGEDRIPGCVREQHVDEAETGGAGGLSFLVRSAFSALWYTRDSYDSAEHCVYPAQEALEVAGGLVEEFLGPRPHPPGPAEVREEAGLAAEHHETITYHELVEMERTSQAQTVAALRAGASPAELRAPAEVVGHQIAEWTARLL